MYPQDGNGWQSSRPQEPRGNGGSEPYPESCPGDNNLHQVSAFQPNSAAFEYMRSLDSQSPPRGGTSPPRQREYQPQPTPQEQHSPTASAGASRHSRTPRRMRRTTRATGAAADADAPGPTGAASRIVSDAPVSMPSNRAILMTGPVQSTEINRPTVPPAASMPGVGVGVYDDEPMASNGPNVASSSPYDSAQPAPPSGLHLVQSDGSYLPAAPYQNMMQNFNNNAPDPTVERARNLMAGRTDTSAADSRPMPVAGRPVPPETPPVEPSVPPAQLRRRILSNKPKREPDLVRGKVVQQIQSSSSSSKKTHVLCVGCGVMLQISKTAIVVHCRNCNGVHPTASCEVPNNGH
jgi:hypothetical protein